MSGSIGVIYVGGNTHVEQVERLHRVDDANKAIKSAIEEGIVPGGGVALIRASSGSALAIPVIGDETIGLQIIFDACSAPLRKMILNSGKDPDFMIRNLSAKDMNLGYNIKDGSVVDMIEAKIIDPVKVVRCALQNAASVAGQVINSDVMIVEMG